MFLSLSLVYEWGRVWGLQSHIRAQNHGKLPPPTPLLWLIRTTFVHHLQFYTLNIIFLITVKKVIVPGRKFCEKFPRHFTWGLFSRHYFYFLHKEICVLFLRVGNFCKEDKCLKNTKITPTQKISTFTVMSCMFWNKSFILISTV